MTTDVRRTRATATRGASLGAMKVGRWTVIFTTAMLCWLSLAVLSASIG